MSNDLEGTRRRYYSERLIAEARVGSPLHEDISRDARLRLLREVHGFVSHVGGYGNTVYNFYPGIVEDASRVLGVQFERATFIEQCADLAIPAFLTVLELSADEVHKARRMQGIDALQSILADDLSAFRIRMRKGRFEKEAHVERVESAHLTEQLVDRTFELTRVAAFDSAQRDYAEAWKHYLRGDFDDAMVNAHKAVESACKLAVKRADPTSEPDSRQLGWLVQKLMDLDVLPSRLSNVVSGLRSIFEHSGSLRNNAGTAHGSVDLASPEANVALLGLHLSASLVSFLAARQDV
jgi:hypothetical protein